MRYCLLTKKREAAYERNYFDVNGFRNSKANASLRYHNIVASIQL